MAEFKIQTREAPEDEKRNSGIGVLVVITGASGAGKDSVVDEILKHKIITTLSINRVVTCTDRPIRTGEAPDAYHFLSSEELNTMHEQEELVEQITQTGTSRKATSKTEIARLLLGENLVWRIDPSRAAEVAMGGFFNKHFPEHAQLLQENTLVICINAPKDVIESRRKRREKDSYNPEEFRLRDMQEAPHLDILIRKAVVVENPDGRLAKTVNAVAELIAVHHDKIKNKKN